MGIWDPKGTRCQLLGPLLKYRLGVPGSANITRMHDGARGWRPWTLIPDRPGSTFLGPFPEPCFLGVNYTRCFLGVE